MPEEPTQQVTTVSSEPVQPTPLPADLEPVAAPAKNSPGVLVLQWLTYAFWGWTVLALTWLTALSVSFFVNRSEYDGDYGSGVSYALAAVLVLFVISFICDFLYSRHEPLQKHGAAMVIMIIHAVIFALFGIGAVITGVFSIVNLVIGSNDGTEGALTVLITSAIIAVVYGATLLRTLRPFKLKRVTLVFSLFMAIVAIVITALGIAGPVIFAAQSKDDRLIERALPTVSDAIRTYTEKSDELPKSLSDIRGSLRGDAKELVDKGLVEYKPGNKVTELAPVDPDSTSLVRPNDASVFSYELCVTYTHEKGTPSMHYANDGGYDSVSPDTYRHDAGRVCYDLRTNYSRHY